MKTAARWILVLGGVVLLIYPFWGIFYPASFATELSEHYAFAEGASVSQIRASAAMLWISNGVMAVAFISLARYIAKPDRVTFAKLAGTCLMLYPFFRIVVEVWSGINLTSHTADAEVPIHVSSEQLFFIVFGLALLGMSSAWAELDR